MPHSEEHRRKVSEALKASWTPERRALLSHKCKTEGNNLPKVHTKEWRERQSRRMSGENNPFFGKTHSYEAIAQFSAGRRGTTRQLIKYGVSPEQYTSRLKEGFLWCSYHKDFAPAIDFKTRWGHTSKSNRCVRCVWVAMLKSEYGMTPEQYESKLAEQGGGCALCGKKFDMCGNQRRNLCQDHDHKTKKNRGILCHKCNSSIERIESIADWSEKALAYLKHYAPILPPYQGPSISGWGWGNLEGSAYPPEGREPV